MGGYTLRVFHYESRVAIRSGEHRVISAFSFDIEDDVGVDTLFTLQQDGLDR